MEKQLRHAKVQLSRSSVSILLNVRMCMWWPYVHVASLRLNSVVVWLPEFYFPQKLIYIVYTRKSLLHFVNFLHIQSINLCMFHKSTYQLYLICFCCSFVVVTCCIGIGVIYVFTFLRPNFDIELIGKSFFLLLSVHLLFFNLLSVIE